MSVLFSDWALRSLRCLVISVVLAIDGALETSRVDAAGSFAVGVGVGSP